MLISEELRSALIAQWVEESENAQIYLYAGAWMKIKGFTNIGNFFIDGREEEEKHAKQIFELLMDLNIPFSSSVIATGEFPINSIRDIAEKFLSREIQTTESLNEIKKLAVEDDSSAASVVEELMREMIKQQRAELGEATDFMDKCSIFDNDWKAIMLWDLEFK
jgi:ferritin